MYCATLKVEGDVDVRMIKNEREKGGVSLIPPLVVKNSHGLFFIIFCDGFYEFF